MRRRAATDASGTAKYRQGEFRDLGTFEAGAFPFAITPHEDSGDPSQLTGMRRRSVNGMFASVKNRRPMLWSRTAERDLMVLLELDPRVASYLAKPEEVEYVLDGRKHRHVPSFRALTDRGDLVLDALSDESARTDQRRLRTSALTALYRRRGEAYRQLYGREIRLQPRFGNARDMLAERAYRPGPDESLQLVGLLTRKGTATVGDVRAALPRSPNPVGLVCSLAIAGTVLLDLSAGCREQVRIRLRPGAAR